MADRPTDSHRRRRNHTLSAASSSVHFHSIPLTTVLPPQVNAPFTALVQEASADNRRVRSVPVNVAPSSPVKRLRLQAHDTLEQEQEAQRQRVFSELERYEVEGEEDDEGEDDETVDSDPKKPADPAASQWLSLHRNTFLRALLWRDGWRGVPSLCPGCKDANRPAVIRCKECFEGTLWCAGCCAQQHQDNPLHWVEKWTGTYFARYSLRECGLRVQLGHHSASCPNPRRGRDNFVMLHTNGIHDVNVDFCGCYHTVDADFLQLLRVGWYPSTTLSPQTCATLPCLERFHTLSLHSKTSAYDFYAALETLTDGVGVKPPDRYKIFLRVVRQYRHLMLLKRGGRGYDCYGVMGTASGELAVRCPACPRPEVNLPPHWQSAPLHEQFLYTIWIALDACFRLKRRLISSDAKDPVFGPGWAYMVDPAPYKEYLAEITDQDDISTCSGLAAVEQANNKFSRGYAATGVGMGRGERFVLRGRMTKGIKTDLEPYSYSNMDWIFLSLLRHVSHLLWIIVSYDIVCQWTKNLKERVKNLAPRLRIQVVWALMRFVIPKLHILGHVALCRLLFSLLLLRGGAQTDGEGIERPWSMIGAVAASTRASGPGSRSDQLDNHWSFWNWRKLISLALLLRCRSDKAKVELEKQETSLKAFSEEQAEMVPEWTRMVHEWEEDHSKFNPYEATVEVEEEQRRVWSLAELKRAKSTTMKINLRRARRRLNKSISGIRALQATYSPSALIHLQSLALPQDTLAEKVPLLPPSSLAQMQRSNGGCREGLLEIERELRGAQCRSVLAALRNQLHVKYCLFLHKKHHSRHQRANTRSRAVIARNENKILLQSDKYQTARRALVAIAGDAGGVSWPLLLKEDIRFMDDSDEGTWQTAHDSDVFGEDTSAPRRQGESRRTVSWIWRFTGQAGTDKEMQESLRVEWCKAYSRTWRWRKELRLLEEEWRRLPLSFAYEEKRWDDRATAIQNLTLSESESEGLTAYAAKQADMYRDLARRAEEVRIAPKLRRGSRWGRETVWVYRGAASVLEEGYDIEDEPVDEHGNESDEEDEGDV
ncbi:CxC2 domain-containing protein [Mycena kentingensis (nom. inval.)]|nr:CxC2 domain-containing protein [Mycena kentingensis (nom. inval.)]